MMRKSIQKNDTLLPDRRFIIRIFALMDRRPPWHGTGTDIFT